MNEVSMYDGNKMIEYLKNNLDEIIEGYYRTKDSPRDERFVGMLDMTLNPNALLIFDEYGSITMIPLTNIEYIKVDRKWHRGKEYRMLDFLVKFVKEQKDKSPYGGMMQ